MKCFINMKPLVALLLCASVSVSTGVISVAAAPGNDQAVAAPTTIQSVQMRGDADKAELVIEVSAPATYTSYKTAGPDRLVVDFSQVVPAAALAGINVSKGPVKGVTVKKFDTDAGVLTRMEIYLTQNIEPVITPSMEKTGELKVTFPGYTAPQVVAQPETPAAVPAEKTQTTIVAVPAAEKTEAVKAEPAQVAEAQTTASDEQPVITKIISAKDGIDILATADIKDYKTFRLNKPERVVIDIAGVKLGVAEKLVSLNTAGVSSARVGSYPDKVRIVLDAINGSLPDAVISKSATGLHIEFKTPTEVSSATPVVPSAPVAAPAPAQVQAVSKKAAPVAATEAKVEAPSSPAAAKKAANAQVAVIDFQVVENISRIMVKVTGNPAVDNPVKSAGTISFRIKNAGIPRHLQRSFDTREFVSPVLRVTPVLVKTKTGNDILIRVALKEDAQSELRQEADIVYLDVKHPADMLLPAKPVTKPAVADKSASAAKAAGAASAPAAAIHQLDKAAEKSQVPGKREYTGRKVTLEFADAEVRKIFQLLSEVSNKNFVLGDEVTGNISLKLVNVPWDQALDIILDTKGLDKREEGNIVLIRGKGKFKSLMDEEIEIRKAALKGEPLETAMFDVNYADLASIVTQFNALKTDRGMITQDQRTNKIIVKDVKTAIEDMRNILKSLDIPEKQVMIEARIVEASSTFTQSLGVNWGIHYRDGSAAIAGINAFDTSFGGLANNVAPTSGVSGNPGATAGISFGTLSSNIKLDMRLNAAVAAGLVRIVSTPRVATLNHKSAKITQGQQIPYTSSTSDKIETKFVEAALALEVTPHINPNGTIVMKIDAKNDAPGSTGSPPPINKKQATTEMMLRDGETTVIGGIYVERETGGEEGVPLMKDIPWLGNLFKSTDTKRSKDELLIFITPRIITPSI